MTTLVVGASGATGKLLVTQLLERFEHVRVIVRSKESLPEAVLEHENITVINASILELTAAELAEYVSGCDAVVSCLGHNLTLKGMFGAPHKLVTEATRRLCNAVKANDPTTSVKFVLMNTTGNRNRDLDEPISFSQKCVITLIRLLLPPHADNETAADFLRVQIGQHDESIEWAVVRPDSLIDESQTSEYTVHESPTRSAIFDAGKTSRINVGSFMADLITNDTTWNDWKGKMPVLYNLVAEPALA